MLHVGYLPATVEEVHFPQLNSSAISVRALKLLSDRIEGNLPDAAHCCRYVRAFNHIAERAPVRRFPLTPQQVVHDVRQVMPEDGVVCPTMACTKSGSRITTAHT